MVSAKFKLETVIPDSVVLGRWGKVTVAEAFAHNPAFDLSQEIRIIDSTGVDVTDQIGINLNKILNKNGYIKICAYFIRVRVDEP